MSLNVVVLVGNVTRDPEIRATPKGSSVAQFGIAVNNPIQKDKVTFVDITAWAQQAEFAHKYFKKGSSISVTGRLEMDTWEDKNGGGKRSKLYVVADRLGFVGGKSDGNKTAEGGRATTTAPGATGTGSSQSAPAPAGGDVDEDVPF